MNPLDGLSVEALQAIAVYSWFGAAACLALGLWEIDKARRAAASRRPAVVIAPSGSFFWARCPSGHCKVLTNRDWSCPECGARVLPFESAEQFVVAVSEAAS